MTTTVNNERARHCIATVLHGELVLVHRSRRVNLYWRKAREETMVGVHTAILADTMWGLGDVLAGETVDPDGYPLIPPVHENHGWLICQLAADGAYLLSADRRELYWLDPCDELAEDCAPRHEREVVRALRATQARQSGSRGRRPIDESRSAAPRPRRRAQPTASHTR
jgi:hypothetical protein